MGVSGGLTSKGVVKWCVESVWVTLCVQSPPNGEIAPRRTTLQPSGVFSPTGDYFIFSRLSSIYTSKPMHIHLSSRLQGVRTPTSLSPSLACLLAPSLPSSHHRCTGTLESSHSHHFRCFWKQVKVLNSHSSHPFVFATQTSRAVFACVCIV